MAIFQFFLKYILEYSLEYKYIEIYQMLLQVKKTSIPFVVFSPLKYLGLLDTSADIFPPKLS